MAIGSESDRVAAFIDAAGASPDGVPYRSGYAAVDDLLRQRRGRA